MTTPTLTGLQPIRDLPREVFIDLWLESGCVAGTPDKQYILRQGGRRGTTYRLQQLIDNRHETLSVFTAHGLNAAVSIANRLIRLDLKPGDFIIWRRVAHKGYGFEQSIPCRVTSVSPARVRVQPILEGGIDNPARKAVNVHYNRLHKMDADDLKRWELSSHTPH